MTSSSLVTGDGIMESLLRSQVFSLTSTTYQLAADSLSNYLSADLHLSDVSREQSLNVENLNKYSLAQVAQHDTINDCWVVIYDKVYDLGQFIDEHPGGGDVLIENAGLDATIAFRGVGHSHDAVRMMDKYCIGILIESERMYLKKKKKRSLFR